MNMILVRAILLYKHQLLVSVDQLIKKLFNFKEKNLILLKNIVIEFNIAFINNKYQYFLVKIRIYAHFNLIEQYTMNVSVEFKHRLFKLLRNMKEHKNAPIFRF